MLMQSGCLPRTFCVSWSRRRCFLTESELNCSACGHKSSTTWYSSASQRWTPSKPMSSNFCVKWTRFRCKSAPDVHHCQQPGLWEIQGVVLTSATWWWNEIGRFITWTCNWTRNMLHFVVMLKIVCAKRGKGMKAAGSKGTQTVEWCMHVFLFTSLSNAFSQLHHCILLLMMWYFVSSTANYICVES